MIRLSFSCVFFLAAVICIAVDDTSGEENSDAVIHQESLMEEKDINQNRLAKVLEDLRSLDHHDLKKVRRILIKQRILKKLNKALRKESGKGILMNLAGAAVNNIGENGQLTIHQLKRLLAHSKKASSEKLEMGFHKADIKQEMKLPQSPNHDSVDKKTEDVKAEGISENSETEK